MNYVKRICRFALGAFVACVAVAVFQFIVVSPSVSKADSFGSPMWIANGIAPYQSCSNWRDDTGYFPGTTTQFNYYWSGQPWWWNNSTAHVCWHNDEGTGSNAWWRAIDIPAPHGTAVSFIGVIFASSMASTQYFDTSACGGVVVSVWTPNGAFA